MRFNISEEQGQDAINCLIEITKENKNQDNQKELIRSIFEEWN